MSPERVTRTTLPAPGVGNPAASDSSSTYNSPSGPTFIEVIVVNPAFELTTFQLKNESSGPANPGSGFGIKTPFAMVITFAHCGSIGKRFRLPTYSVPCSNTNEVGTI